MAGQAFNAVALLGHTLGHYRLVEKIGSGGMGEVYRAQDEHLDREVAVKVLPSGTVGDETARRRFRKEARSLSKLNHPNVATVHDFDTQDGIDYLVMEYVPGKTLRNRISEGPLPEAEVIHLAIQLAQGLTAAHELGLVHRDLKPDNVRLTLDGRVKILDFGLATLIRPLTEARTTESSVSAVAGTLPYMAPEQVMGAALDRRADLFSFGIVLYEMAAGRRPFQASSPGEMCGAILYQEPVPLLQLNPELSPGLHLIISRMLEKDRDLRYGQAAEILADLQRLNTGLETGPFPAAASGAPRVESNTKIGGRRKRLAPAAMVAGLLVVLCALWLLRPRTSRGPASTQPVSTSIAVLPFADMSAEKNQEYFSDGLAEELIHDLAKIQGLRVAARTSSFQFRGNTVDPQTVGKRLNVAAILEGSVRKDGNKVRITAQLINAATGFNLWSETYDRKLSDIFAVQEDIGRSVAASLKVTLLGVGTEASAAQGKNPQAYNAYLQGEYFRTRRSQQNLERAAGYYEQAINLDPDYAQAWAGLAEVRSSQADYAFLPTDQAYGEARKAAERAVTLNPNLAQAHAATGWIKNHYDWDWTGADASFQRALALEPGNADTVRRASLSLFTLGRFDEAISLIRRAVQLDPLSAGAYDDLGQINYYAGRDDEAVAAFNKTLELNPSFPAARVYLGRVALERGDPQRAMTEMEREPDAAWRGQGLALTYFALGRKAEADAALAAYVSKYHAGAAFQIAEIYAFRGETNQAFAWLERAYAQRDAGLSEMKGDPLLKNLERDPRYTAFLKKMRLPL